MNLFQVYIEDVEKDAKALKASKQAQTKKCLERIQIVQKDLQESVSEVIAQYISKQYKSNLIITNELNTGFYFIKIS